MHLDSAVAIGYNSGLRFCHSMAVYFECESVTFDCDRLSCRPVSLTYHSTMNAINIISLTLLVCVD